jgi:hypothetical protein
MQARGTNCFGRICRDKIAVALIGGIMMVCDDPPHGLRDVE